MYRGHYYELDPAGGNEVRKKERYSVGKHLHRYRRLCCLGNWNFFFCFSHYMGVEFLQLLKEGEGRYEVVLFRLWAYH